MNKGYVKNSVFLLVFCALLLLAPRLGFNVHAAGNAPIPGIDYTRLTQKASYEMADFNVSMFLDDVEIKGKMYGSEGLTMGEMNEIILDQLALAELSLEDVELMSSLGENLDREAWKEIGKRYLVALSEYIPAIGPGESVSPTDLLKHVLYGNNPATAVPQSFAEGKVKKAIEKKIIGALQKEAAKMGKKITKKGGGLWFVGFALNSVSFEKDLWDNTELDKFLDRMEEDFAEISEFYGKCSRKLNEAAELKNFGRGVIVFDEKSTAVSECTFLGVDGVRLKYTITGTLRKQIGPDDVVVAGDNSGTYEGDLKLEIEGYDFASDFDAVFADKSTLWRGHTNDWGQILYRFDGAAYIYRDEFLNKFIFTVNRPTYLKRTLVGHFSVKIPKAEIKGTMTPVLSGAFNNVSDGIDFLFRMNFGQEFKIPVKEPYTMKDLGLPVQQWHVETFLQGARSIDALHCSWVGNQAARVMMEGSVGQLVYGGAGQDILIKKTDLGTVWKKLEKAPIIQISEFMS